MRKAIGRNKKPATNRSRREVLISRQPRRAEEIAATARDKAPIAYIRTVTGAVAIHSRQGAAPGNRWGLLSCGTKNAPLPT